MAAGSFGLERVTMMPGGPGPDACYRPDALVPPIRPAAGAHLLAGACAR